MIRSRSYQLTVEELVPHGDAELARVPRREDRRLAIGEELSQIDIDVRIVGPQSRQEEFAVERRLKRKTLERMRLVIIIRI
jgi:hypothetical protein